MPCRGLQLVGLASPECNGRAGQLEAAEAPLRD